MDFNSFHFAVGIQFEIIVQWKIDRRQAGCFSLPNQNMTLERLCFAWSQLAIVRAAACFTHKDWHFAHINTENAWFGDIECAIVVSPVSNCRFQQWLSHAEGHVVTT